MLCVAISTRDHLGGRVGGSQMITLDHNGAGVWKGPKYDPAILEWPLREDIYNKTSQTGKKSFKYISVKF